MLNLTKMHGFYPIFNSTYRESNSNDHLQRELVQTKFNMVTICPDNHHQSFWQLIDHSVLRVLA